MFGLQIFLEILELQVKAYKPVFNFCIYWFLFIGFLFSSLICFYGSTILS